MKKLFAIDYWFFTSVLVLILLGIVALASVSSIPSQEKFGKSDYYFLHQLERGIIPGLILGLIAFLLPLSFFKRFSFLAVIFSLFLMSLVFLPWLGVGSGGARRWINIGISTLQPSELLKLSLIIYLSAWLEKKLKTKKTDWKTTLLPFVMILGMIFLLLFFQSNASTLALIFAIAVAMYFLSGTPVWHTGALFLGGLSLMIPLILSAPYRLNRIMVALGLVKDPMGLGYQIKQSLITIGSGGFFGTGLGMSGQKFGGLLPQTMSDSIFSIFAQEAGFLGSFLLIFFFVFMFIRSMRIGKKSHEKFSQIFMVGFAFWICLQAFINIGAMTQMIPLTGVPLPFISYGGSHIIVELIAVGIALNISRRAKEVV